MFSDNLNHRVRRIGLDGRIATIAGGATAGFAGDGGAATSAALLQPDGVAFDAEGRLLIADQGNHRLRRVDEDGIITTIAGTGEAGDGGDHGPAFEATLNLPQGLFVDADGHVFVATLNRVRRIAPDGIITTVAGAVHPRGPGPVDRALLYPSRAVLSLDGGLFSVGAFGRMLHVDLDAARPSVDVAAAYSQAHPSVHTQGLLAPLFEDARGVVFDPIEMALLVTEFGTGNLRRFLVDMNNDGVIDDPSTWRHDILTTPLVGPAGIVWEAASDTFIVVDEADHCVRRMARGGALLDDTVSGRCGRRGSFPGFLNSPTHVAISPTTGALYVADTENHRVVRVDDNDAVVVLGDGSVSSAGEGEPARLFPVHAPRQLAVDAFGNLFVTSTTTVRLIANIDDDEDADADDRVLTIFGGGDRTTFPESVSLCLSALTLDDAGQVVVTDACQGLVVALTP